MSLAVYNKTKVKESLTGYGRAALIEVAGLAPEVLDGRPHPCPACGGKDRFNSDRQGALESDGKVFCNKPNCLTGDALHVIMKVKHRTFPEALQELGDWLVKHRQLSPEELKGKRTATRHKLQTISTSSSGEASKNTCTDSTSTVKHASDKVRQSDTWKNALRLAIGKGDKNPKRGAWREEQLRMYAENKRGIKAEPLIESKVQVIYKGGHDGFVIVFIGVTTARHITGYQIARCDGQDFNETWPTPRKTHTAQGSTDGWFIPAGIDAAISATTIIKCEGPSDTLALHGILPKGFVAIGNLCGAGSWPKNDIQWLKSKNVIVIHDADSSGQDGATKLCKAICETASSVKNLKLPFEVTDTHGKDLREWIADGRTFEDIAQLAQTTPNFTLAVSNDLQEDEERQKRIAAERERLASLASSESAREEFELANGKQFEGETLAFPLSIITKTLNLATNSWPKTCGGLLFHYDEKSNRLRRLDSTAKLFAWIGDQLVKPPAWLSSPLCHTKQEFYAHLVDCQEQFDSIESLPHEPAVARQFYAHPKLPESSGNKLDLLLQRFSVATELDRVLIAALFATTIWGGAGGERPIFLISADGQGAGKSTLARVVGTLAGGMLDILPNERHKQVKERMLSPDGRLCRLALIDNMKGQKISNAELEGMITAPRISGRALYIGEASRPNLITWMITANAPDLSRDLAQRVVNIQLKRALYEANWVTQTMEFVDEHRWEIIADIAGVLRGACVPLRRHTRWANWESEVLSRLSSHGDDLITLIKERRNLLDADNAEAISIEEAFSERLVQLGYAPETDHVLLPSHVVHEWFQAILGKPITKNSVSRKLNGDIENGLITRLIRSRRSDFRGYQWIATADSLTIHADIDVRIRQQNTIDTRQVDFSKTTVSVTHDALDDAFSTDASCDSPMFCSSDLHHDTNDTLI